MKYIKKYLETVVKIKPLGELTIKDDELNGMSGEMIYIDGKCSDIFISHADYANWLEKQGKETSWKPSEEEMDVLYGLAYITNQYDEHKEEVITRLYQDLKREFFNGSSYENMFPTTEDDVRRRSTIQVLEYARSLDTYNQYGKADIDKNIAWLKKQGEKNSAWSEEDEKTLNEIFSVAARASLRKSTLFGKSYDYIKWQNWLKSLKDRVQPQSNWKPSEEQMDVLLSEVTAWTKGCSKQIVLESLYQDLNKLKGE